MVGFRHGSHVWRTQTLGLPLKFLGKSSLEMDFVDEFDVITAIFMLQFSENVDELGKVGFSRNSANSVLDSFL